MLFQFSCDYFNPEPIMRKVFLYFAMLFGAVLTLAGIYACFAGGYPGPLLLTGGSLLFGSLMQICSKT